MVSESVKKIYNTYLAVTRSCENKPFKLRQDFSNFYETENFVLTKKIERFLLKHPDIDIQTFFKAPYMLHPGEVFDLKFYTTLSAVKAYTNYINTLYSLPFDSSFHLNLIGTSLKFIKQYCQDKNISPEQYTTFSENGIYPAWFSHLKNRRVSPLVLYGYSDVKNIMDSAEKDMIELLIPVFYRDYYPNLSKFKASNKAKLLVSKGLALINKQ